MAKIPVTYQCWGCGSEETRIEEIDEPIPNKVVWNLCKDCQKKRGINNVKNDNKN